MKDTKKTVRAKARPSAAEAAPTLALEATAAAAPARAKAPARRAPKAVPAAAASVPAPAPAPEPVKAKPAPAPAPEPVEAMPAPAKAPVESVPAPVPTLVETVVAPLAALDVAGPAAAAPALLAKAQGAGETLRSAMSESALAATRGLVEINGQMLDLVRAQSDVTLSLWRQAMTAGTVSEAIRVQTSGLRQAYETSAAHWKAIAETAGRTAQAALRPIGTGTRPGA